MRKHLMLHTGILGLCILPFIGTAHAADPVTFSGLFLAQNEQFRFSVEAGYLTARANEYVYEEGRTVSRLIWDINAAATITARAEMNMTPRWRLSGSATVGIDHSNFMADYDWLTPSPDWSHRSVHWDTQLDHYVALDLGASYAAWQINRTTLNILGGLRYTDFQLSSYGGSFVYTTEDGEFRGDSLSFADGQAVITYRQRLPALYGGLGASRQIGSVHFDAGILGGVTLWPRDKDHHWLRSLKFKDEFKRSPYLALQMRASVPVSDNGEAFLSARYEKYFRMEGDTHILDTRTGESSFSHDSAGASLQTLNIGVGLRFRF